MSRITIRQWTILANLSGLLATLGCGQKPSVEARQDTIAHADSFVPLADTAPTASGIPAAMAPAPAHVDRHLREVPPPPARAVIAEPAPAATPPEPPPAEPVAVPAAPARLEAGTAIDVTAIDSIHSRYNRVGDLVHMQITHDITNSAGAVVIPTGSVITMSITAIAEAPQRGDKGTLVLAAQSVEINGRTYPIVAGASDYEYLMKARGVGTSEVAKTGAGAVAGGILGRLIGGNRTGTELGALGGAAAGAAIAAKTAHRDIVVPAGAHVTLTLEDPFSRTH